MLTYPAMMLLLIEDVYMQLLNIMVFGVVVKLKLSNYDT